MYATKMSYVAEIVCRNGITARVLITRALGLLGFQKRAVIEGEHSVFCFETS